MLKLRRPAVQSGFSLVELMIGIVILSILAAVAVPSFQQWLQNTQVRNAAESISSGLQRARSEAVSRNTNIEFILSADSSWTICLPGDGLTICPASSVIETRSASEGSKNVTVTTDPPGLDTVTFNNFGALKSLPDDKNDDGSDQFTQVDVDSSVLPAADSQELSITIGLGGNVRMCDPNAPSGNPRAC